MRNIWLVIFLGGCIASGQSILENSAAAAGGSVGGVAGKKVSDGLSKIFGKVDAAAGKAAAGPKRNSKNNGPEPLLEVGPGTPRPDGSSVPPPPQTPRRLVRHVAAAPVPPSIVETPAPAPPSPPPPPPPPVTASDLQKIAPGMSRDAVLRIGEPSSRITMSDDDHLTEIFHYVSKDTDVGEVHLTDGVVSSVQVP